MLSIASQLDALQKAAEDSGYDLPAEFLFIDDGYSGSTLDRPALDRLRDLVNEGALDVVLIYAPDRLARHYAYQVVVLEEFKRAGCEVRFLNHAFGQSPAEQMLLQIQGVFAEYERALIKERTRRGRLFAARQGRVNWGGNPPYGFRYIRKTETAPQQLVVSETEVAIVQQLYRWLVEEELSSYAIQKRLTERQVPTRGNNTQGWCQSSVIKILRNPLYKGEAAYNRSQQADTTRPRGSKGLKDIRPGNNRSRIARPREEWITVRVPALVDPDLWESAQAQLAHNRERATRNNTKHDYLLRGLLVCGRCGRRLIGVWSRVSGGRYMCSARVPRSAPWSCIGRSVAAARVEPLIWNYVQESEYRPQAGGLLSDAPSKGALEASFLIRGFLFSNILLHTLQLEPHRGHRVTARPKVRAGEIPLLLLYSPGDGQRALPFHKPHHRRHRMLRRNLNTHMDMIRQQVPLNDPALLLACQLVTNLSQRLPQLPIDRLATILGDKDHVILAIPPRVGQAFHCSRHGQFSFR